jgi:hypothetical protein
MSAFPTTNAIRSERSFGVTATLKPNQRQHLLALIHSEVWTDLLDVMEMQCIEIETDLINTPVEEEQTVISNHKYAKAAWVIFTRFQQKIVDESQVYLRTREPQPEYKPLDKQEEWRNHLLDPMRPAPEDGEYFGI